MTNLNSSYSHMKIVDPSVTCEELSKVYIPPHYFERISTGIVLLDNLLSGDGIVPGQQIAVSSPRGVGKSTLLLQLLQGIYTASQGTVKCLYLSGEEYIAQLAYTSQRITTPNVVASNITDIDTIACLTEKYDIMVVDSLSSLSHPTIKSHHAKEEYAINTLVKAAKDNHCAVFYILHATKDGKEKGNSLIGHTVDTVIKLYKVDSETYGENARLIEIEKNRFGSSSDCILKLNQNGWDFSNPINVSHNINSSSSTLNNRAKKKQEEMNQIIDRVTKITRVQLKDLVDICSDIGRTERLLKDLEKIGKLICIGGKSTPVSEKYWTLGCIDDPDDDSDM